MTPEQPAGAPLMPDPRDERVAIEVPQLRRGKVWCKTCGRMGRVHSGTCLREGWPKCCGYTMTIDSPAERRKLSDAPTP